jgi:hypothetical protein
MSRMHCTSRTPLSRRPSASGVEAVFFIIVLDHSDDWSCNSIVWVRMDIDQSMGLTSSVGVPGPGREWRRISVGSLFVSTASGCESRSPRLFSTTGTMVSYFIVFCACFVTPVGFVLSKPQPDEAASASAPRTTIHLRPRRAPLGRRIRTHYSTSSQHCNRQGADRRAHRRSAVRTPSAKSPFAQILCQGGG